MIFVGDVASPNFTLSRNLGSILRNSPVFSGKDLVLNLEGLISDDLTVESTIPILFNHSSVLDCLKSNNCKAVTIANNHTLDIPEYFDDTILKLKEYKINYTGAGKSVSDANKPAVFHTSEGDEIVLFTQCWSVMLQHQKNPTNGVYVATINESILFENIKKYREKHKEASLVVYFHWNFDLETLPFPADRKIARELIDLGVDLVLGCHSHCIQGAEFYKNKPIIYGLGNFYIPWYTYINGHISFPDFTKKELAVEWNPTTNEIELHYFYYKPDNNHELFKFKSELFKKNKQGIIHKEFSSYQGLNEKEYLAYFKKYRRKKILVPVFESYNNNVENYLKNIWIILRIRALRYLAKQKIRAWNN
jgi:poly-gamma-glutamate synthesis protein (capsule biosynthesis protein)